MRVWQCKASCGCKLLWNANRSHGLKGLAWVQDQAGKLGKWSQTAVASLKPITGPKIPLPLVHVADNIQIINVQVTLPCEITVTWIILEGDLLSSFPDTIFYTSMGPSQEWSQTSYDSCPLVLMPGQIPWPVWRGVLPADYGSEGTGSVWLSTTVLVPVRAERMWLSPVVSCWSSGLVLAFYCCDHSFISQDPLRKEYEILLLNNSGNKDILLSKRNKS